jgi:hypothetical protein
LIDRFSDICVFLPLSHAVKNYTANYYERIFVQ